MALADPQSVTITGATVSLPRTGMGASEGSFRSSDAISTMLVRHSAGKRVRHNIVLRQDKTVADPFVPSQNRPVSFQASLTIDTPLTGVSAVDALALANALVAWATSAQLARVIGGES